MKLNYMECWNGAMNILVSHKEALAAIAGVFIFLPTLLTAQFVGEPPLTGTEEGAEILAVYTAFFQENWPALVISNLLISFGGLAIYFTISPSQSGTVGDHLAKAAKFFIFFILANILNGMATMLGMLALIIPGLYVAARLTLVPVIISDQEERSPVEALRKSWALTKDNGFSILLFVIIVALVGTITIGVISMLVGLIVGLATGGEGWLLIQNLVTGLTGAAFQVLLIAVIVSIYEQLTGKATNVEDIFN